MSARAPDLDEEARQYGRAKYDGQPVNAALLSVASNTVEPFPLKTYSGMPAAPTWLFDGLLEAGTCAVLGAEPKAGKTWLTFDMGIALATGQTFLGEWKATELGPTLYYSPEGGHRSRHARMMGLCWGRALDPETVLPSLPFVDARIDLGADDHAERLARTIDATKARLVVIDPLVSAHLGIDENAAGDVMKVLNPLRDMITERPWCSLVVVHHTNKGAKAQSRNLGLRGSSAIDGWWDTLITLRRADDDSAGPRRIDIAHRDAAAPEPIGFELVHRPAEENPELSWFRLHRCEVPDIGGGTSGAGRKLNSGLLADIEDLVRRQPGELTRSAGASMLGESRPTFNRHFERLVKDGKLSLSADKKMWVAS